MTVAEQIEQRGIKKGEILGLEKGEKLGLKKGEKLGLKKGLKKGKADLLLKMIYKRFGSFSPLLEKKMKDADITVLDRFTDSILDFRTLKDAEKWWDKQ